MGLSGPPMCAAGISIVVAFFIFSLISTNVVGQRLKAEKIWPYLSQSINKLRIHLGIAEALSIAKLPMKILGRAKGLNNCLGSQRRAFHFKGLSTLCRRLRLVMKMYLTTQPRQQMFNRFMFDWCTARSGHSNCQFLVCWNNCICALLPYAYLLL